MVAVVAMVMIKPKNFGCEMSMPPISEHLAFNGLSASDRYCGRTPGVPVVEKYQIPVVTMMTVIGSRTFLGDKDQLDNDSLQGVAENEHDRDNHDQGEIGNPVKVMAQWVA
jgi:hypothetical protein